MSVRGGRGLRSAAVLSAWTCLGAVMIPPNAHVSVTDRSIVIDSEGMILSTATICPGFAFDQFGPGGPHLSPNQHWVLVDIRGPFAPGNVQRNHALVQVATGRVVTSPDFPRVIGVPGSLDPLAWASGERAALRYKNGSTATVRDPPPRPLPTQICTTPAPP